MTKEEVHQRFVAIVAKVDAALEANKPSEESEETIWYFERPTVDGRVMPVKPEYNGGRGRMGR